jgi:hypothetical protein
VSTELKVVLLSQDGAENEFAANGQGLDRCDSVQEDEVNIALS